MNATTLGPIGAGLRSTAEPAEPDHFGPVPPEAELVLSAMDVAGSTESSRRRNARRMAYRVVAALKLYSDAATATPWVLYTRDADPRGIGFVTRHRLPLGYGGAVTLPDPDGNPVTVSGTLFRCREAAPGWYEGALYFNREQWAFAAQDVPAV